MESLVVHSDSYELDQGELAHTHAARTAPSSTAAPPVSVVRKSRTGVARLRAQAVRSVNAEARVASASEPGDSPPICIGASLVDAAAGFGLRRGSAGAAEIPLKHLQLPWECQTIAWSGFPVRARGRVPPAACAPAPWHMRRFDRAVRSGGAARGAAPATNP